MMSIFDGQSVYKLMRNMLIVERVNTVFENSPEAGVAASNTNKALYKRVVNIWKLNI